MLTGLGHGAVGSGHDQDSAVHLSSAGDHVLHVVGVAGAVHVRVVTLFGFVLHVSGVDGNSTRFFFGSLIDVFVLHGLSFAHLSQRHGDGRGQGGLAVVDVTDGADVYMGLRTFKMRFRHGKPTSCSITVSVFIRYGFMRLERVMGIEPT